MIVETIMKIYGLNDIISGKNAKNKLGEIKVVVDDEGSVERTRGNNLYNLINSSKYLINLIYLLFILGNVIWVPMYAVIKSVVDKDILFITSNVFLFLYLLQYLTSVNYYRCKHYKEIKTKFEEYSVFIGKLYLFSVILNIAISSLFILLISIGHNSGIYNDIYDELSNVGKGFFIIAIFLNKFYSFGIALTNVVTFFIVFVFQSHNAKYFYENLEKFVDDDTEDFKIDSLLKDYSELKDYHTYSVKSLNDVFSTVCIFTIIGGYFFVINYNTNAKTNLQYFDIGLNSLLIIVYLYSINEIKNVVGDILTLVGTSKFIGKYLLREAMDDIELSNSKKKASNGDIYSLLRRNLMKNYENTTNIDWLVLNMKLEGEWENFEIGGFEMDDATIFKKLITVFVSLLMLLNLGQNFVLF